MMEENQYPLTLDHVKQFLATKQGNDELGMCGNATWCLLSETLSWLYPQQKPWRVHNDTYQGCGVLDIPLGKKLELLRSAFDYCDMRGLQPIVTKARLKEHLAAKIEEMPFTMDELFDEPISTDQAEA